MQRAKQKSTRNNMLYNISTTNLNVVCFVSVISRSAPDDICVHLKIPIKCHIFDRFIFQQWFLSLLPRISFLVESLVLLHGHKLHYSSIWLHFYAFVFNILWTLTNDLSYKCKSSKPSYEQFNTHTRSWCWYTVSIIIDRCSHTRVQHWPLLLYSSRPVTFSTLPNTVSCFLLLTCPPADVD